VRVLKILCSKNLRSRMVLSINFAAIAIAPIGAESFLVLHCINHGWALECSCAIIILGISLI